MLTGGLAGRFCGGFLFSGGFVAAELQPKFVIAKTYCKLPASVACASARL